MASILDSVTMAQRASSASGPQGGGTGPPIEEVREAAIAFLSKMLPDVRRTNITKLAPINPEQGEWEAEADVHVPNATIKVLGLPTRKEVLDCQPFLLRLDRQLKVTAYGRRDSVQERGK